jgi:hypothetical protein
MPDLSPHRLQGIPPLQHVSLTATMIVPHPAALCWSHTSSADFSCTLCTLSLPIRHITCSLPPPHLCAAVLGQPLCLQITFVAPTYYLYPAAITPVHHLFHTCMSPVSSPHSAFCHITLLSSPHPHTSGVALMLALCPTAPLPLESLCKATLSEGGLESGDSEKASTCFPCFECMKWTLVWCSRAPGPDPHLGGDTKLNWKPPHVWGCFAQALYCIYRWLSMYKFMHENTSFYYFWIY